MCGHNLCNLQSALPRCAPRVLSISAGRGGAGQGLLFAGRGSPFFRGAGRGGAGRASLVASSNWSTWIMMRMRIILMQIDDDDDDDGAGTMREVFQVGGMGQLCKLHCVCHPTFSLRRL